MVLFIGVNGSGKTTTLGKIAADLTGRGAKVLIAAGDTFRAAAVEQLKVLGGSIPCDFISRPTGSDAAGLVFDALQKARDESYDVLLIDTAGRLQNKQGLMDELHKMIRVLRKLDPAAPHEVLLVLDATVGRNALAQENVFGNAIGVTGIVMTKLDGTAWRCACTGGPGFRLADQADRRRGEHRRLATFRRPSVLPVPGRAGGDRRMAERAPPPTWFGWVADGAPAIAFLLVYLVTRDFRVATWGVIAASVVALAASIVVERRVRPLPAVTGGLAVAFGLASVILHDKNIFKDENDDR